ncbi:MAG: hypothetical protein ACK4R6_09260 [Spirosomataceae bacterium]
MKFAIKIYSLLFLLFVAMGCQVTDPFVDRTVAPVLVILETEAGVATSGLTTEPTITASASKNATFSIRLLSLDKTGILDKSVGIDSIPVTGSSVRLALRSGQSVGDFVTDGNGRVTVSVPWSQLGIAAPKAGSAVALNCSGAYKEQAFTKLFRLSAN